MIKDKLLVTKPLFKYYPFCQKVYQLQGESKFVTLSSNTFSLSRSLAIFDSTLIFKFSLFNSFQFYTKRIQIAYIKLNIIVNRVFCLLLTEILEKYFWIYLQGQSKMARYRVVKNDMELCTSRSRATKSSMLGHKLYPVHTTLKQFENAALLLRLDLPLTRSFLKRS